MWPRKLPSPRTRPDAFSWIEALVAGGVIIILALVLIPLFTRERTHSSPEERADLAEALANMRQLQQISDRMAHDGATSVTNHSLAWPGDLQGSFQQWASNLVANEYLTATELARLLSSHDRQLPADVLPFANNAPILVYTVADSTLPGVVFLSTDNFINTPKGGLADTTSSSGWGPDFAIIRKDGSAAVLQPHDIGQTNTIGGFTPLCH